MVSLSQQKCSWDNKKDVAAKYKDWYTVTHYYFWGAEGATQRTPLY